MKSATAAKSKAAAPPVRSYEGIASPVVSLTCVRVENAPLMLSSGSVPVLTSAFPGAERLTHSNEFRRLGADAGGLCCAR